PAWALACRLRLPLAEQSHGTVLSWVATPATARRHGSVRQPARTTARTSRLPSRVMAVHGDSGRPVASQITNGIGQNTALMRHSRKYPRFGIRNSRQSTPVSLFTLEKPARTWNVTRAAKNPTQYEIPRNGPTGVPLDPDDLVSVESTGRA